LIDTPGFQSSNDRHSEAARRSFPDSSAILYLFQPNLVTGEDATMQLVLKGSHVQGIVPKASRTFFIINRADELGVDPVDNPKRYKDLAERKQRELSEALACRGIEVPPKRILCMASDPFGLVGDRKDAISSSYDGNRSWDGFLHFMTAFKEIENDLVRTGAERSLLEGGLARLARLDATRKAERERLLGQSDVVHRMQTLVAERVAEGHRLVAEQRARLIRRVEEHAASLKDEVLSEQNPMRLRIKAQRLQRWWEDPAFSVELQQWGKEALKELEVWRQQTSEAVSRRLDSAEFTGALPDPAVPNGPDAPRDPTGKLRFQRSLVRSGRVMGGATRDVVYNIGTTLGFRFKPWEAVQLAQTLAKVGAVVAVIGVVWDIADAFLEEQRQANREKSRKDIAKWLAKTVPIVVEAASVGYDNEIGLLRAAVEYIAALDAYLGEIRTEQKTMQAAITEVDARRAIYASLRAKAHFALGGHILEEA
jgi:hypothetical protein